jgi:tetratricopeptide (TPR) repeat protein
MLRLIQIFCLFLFFKNLLLAQKPEAIKEYNSGLEYFNLKNFEATIPFMKEAIKKDPSFYYAYRTLITCLEQTGKDTEAIENYEKCIKIAPGDKGLVYNLSQIYIKIKEYEKAVLWLRKAIEIDPTYDKAAQSLKSVEEYLAKNGNTQTVITEHQESGSAAATKVYNDALRLYKESNYSEALKLMNSFEEEVTNPAFYYLMAITCQQMGYRDKAIEAFEMTLELDDRHFDANNALGTIYFNSQRYEEAIPLLETAFDRRKNDRKLLYQLARAHYQHSDFSKAIPLLTSYTEMVTEDAEAFFLLSKSYEKTGDKKKSDQAFEQAKKLGAKGSLADELDRSALEYAKKAGDLSKSGNYQDAINVLEEAITKHSEKASLHFNLGLNYLELGNKEKAAAEFAKTIELDPAQAKAYQSLGTIHYDKADYNSAIGYYNATVKAGKTDAVIYYKLGNCHYNLSQYANAVTEYKKATESGVKEKQFFFGMALAYFKLKEFSSALKALEEAVIIDPDFWEAHYHICLIYLELNENQKALEEASKIIKKNPNYAKAHLVMAHAYKLMGNLADADKSRQTALKLDPSLK